MLSSDSRRTRGKVAFAICALLIGTGLFAPEARRAGAQETATPLWQKRASAITPRSAPEVLRSATVAVDPNRLLASDSMRFSLLLPDERVVNAERIRGEHVGRAYVWHGTLQNEPTSTVSFSVVNETMVGSILTANGQSFRLRRDPDAGHVVEEVDLKKLLPEGQSTPTRRRRQSKAGEPIGDTCSTDDPGEIDVLVVYTQAARAGAGGTDAIEADISRAIFQSNEAYKRSDITQRLRLVHVAEISYSETGNTGPGRRDDGLGICAGGLDAPCHPNDRDQLKDGHVKMAHELRDTHGADIVVMITEKGNFCGYAFLMETIGNTFEDSAFAVVKRECSAQEGKYSFAHEVGHLMGAAHDWGTDGLTGSPYPYNHGHIELAPTTVGFRPWRTIMATDTACPKGCPRIMRFSNPNIKVGVDAAGVSGGEQPEDNHLVLNNTALIVSNFRCSKRGPANVWMRDTWRDLGAEPDPNQPALRMWRSPYIWVRNSADVDLSQQHIHQNPRKGSTNFVYVKAHNGATAPIGGTLKLYRSLAATSLSWPDDWTELGSKAITFEANATRIEEFPWIPGEEGHYSLLARWESPSDPMVGPEGANINANVSANNNIIWRNVNVIDLVVGDTSGDNMFIVRNIDKERPMEASITIRPVQSSISPELVTTFFDVGTVILRLDDKLLDSWKKGGFRGSGFQLSGNTVVVTNSHGAVLEGLQLDWRAEERAWVTFARPRTGNFRRDAFLVEVVQSATGAPGSAIGGITYEVYTDGLGRFPPLNR